MKFLKITNRAGFPIHFVFVTTSPCRCAVCMEWVKWEQYPVVNWPGATFGSLCVGPYYERIERFCDKWDCEGAVFYGAVPWSLSRHQFMDYEDDSDYSVGGGVVELRFTHRVPDKIRENTRVGSGLRLAMTAGRLALMLAGSPDLGAIGDVVGLFSS
jgi:hypothetical protein